MSDLKKLFSDLKGSPLDYSKGENWMVKQDNGDANVDVFFLYPTSVDPKCTDIVSEVDNYMKFKALENFERGGSCFDEFTNIFAPFYRQISGVGILQSGDANGFEQLFHNKVGRTDIYAALDYYFENLNSGRPYILASHSQGSCAMQNVLSIYMKAHPEYYERMIAGYIIGWRYTQEYLDKNPHIKLATGETDTGVVMTWNTEDPGATMLNVTVDVNGIGCINPLNWKTDDTYAGIEENLGSYDIENHCVVEGVADAQIEPKRNVIVSTTLHEHGYKPIPCEPPVTVFGDKSYHFDDWNLFYVNVKENAKKRIEAYFANLDK